MDKVYAPAAIERRLYQLWESAGHFKPRPAAHSYCIVIPPPNVTGTLHMGHAFQDTIMDALTRYHRMRGDSTLWQPGVDHAGIATQMVVERQLNAEGIKRTDLSREAFVERVWAWKEQSGGMISQQLRRLGASVDWTRERFTMDAGLSQAVVEAFVRLHEQGLIYRGQRLVNWDPVLCTALSDIEVLAEEETGSLWHLRYPLCDGSGYLVVATTRPETLLGDAAVAVHPEDARYRHLIGQRVQLPLTGRTIPIIGDTYVDPEFGTGCVKITPAHDFNDYAVGQRHQLPLINIFTPTAHLNDEAPPRLRGLERFAARKQIVEELSATGLVEQITPHKLMTPRGDRSGAVIEPYLTDQWYVRTAPLAARAIGAAESGRVRFVPENWDKTYYQWMRNIQDWCISRQLWWGHRIPAWYDEQGHIYVARSEAEAHEQARQARGQQVTLRQDEDVLDTWFSSALWPFSTLGWPATTPELQRFYPTNVLVTGFDIIFFWVARMLMFGLHFLDEVPFREVYVTVWCWTPTARRCPSGICCGMRGIFLRSRAFTARAASCSPIPVLFWDLAQGLRIYQLRVDAMNDGKKSLRSPLARVRGLAPPNRGRSIGGMQLLLTALALIPLSIYVLATFFIYTVYGGYDGARMWLHSPVSAGFVVLFLAAGL